MLSNSKFFLVIFLCALVLLQSVAALPTRGSYAKLARRANASQKAKRNNYPSAKPAKLRRTIPTSEPAVAPIVREQLVKPTTSIGGDFTEWAAAAGIPVTPISTSSQAAPTAPFVPASNVTLPTAAAKRDLPVQQLAKRVTAHPGAPTSFLTAKINVVGGDASKNASDASGTGLGFTLVDPTTKTSSSIPVAETSKIIKPESTTMPLPTVTRTLTFTVAPSVTQTATVTLVPSQVAGSTHETYVAFTNSSTTASTENEQDCRVVLVKEGESTTNATICGLPEDASNSSIDINVTINNNSISDTTTSSDSVNDEAAPAPASSKSKRQVVAFFEAPKPQKPYTREEMLSEDWEDCIVGVDAGCLELPAKTVYTREEMMSDAWEDCIVGKDADCLALPEN